VQTKVWSQPLSATDEINQASWNLGNGCPSQGTSAGPTKATAPPDAKGTNFWWLIWSIKEVEILWTGRRIDAHLNEHQVGPRKAGPAQKIFWSDEQGEKLASGWTDWVRQLPRDHQWLPGSPISCWAMNYSMQENLVCTLLRANRRRVFCPRAHDTNIRAIGHTNSSYAATKVWGCQLAICLWDVLLIGYQWPN
jgi:hypothetical protein